MEKFFDYILQFGHLNKQQMELIRGKAVEIKHYKDEYFWEAGKTVRQIGFITEGVLRVYYYNNQGEEITRYFIDENHLVLSGNTIDEIYTASEYLSAVTDCRLVTFSKQDWRDITDTIIGWDTIVQKIIAKHYREKMERRGSLVSQDGTERYLDFLQKFPSLVNRVPLNYIASYLGITQSSLSRIRKNIR